MYQEQLENVVTQAEAARMWQRDPTDIEYARDLGKLEWRQAGRIVLISVESLKKLWGQPVNK